MKNELMIVGYGMNIDSQLGVLAFESISKCEKIFVLEVDDSHIRNIFPDKHIVNLFKYYSQGACRTEVYELISNTVLESFSSLNRIALCVEGSPYFLDTIVEILETKSLDKEVGVNVIQGTSSLDNIIHQLRIPVEELFLISTTANQFCTQNINVPQNSVVVLFQPANAISNIINIDCDYIDGIKLLINKIEQQFRANDKWLLVNLGNSSENNTKVIWNEMKNLRDYSDYFHSGTLILSNSWLPSFIDPKEPTIIREDA